MTTDPPEPKARRKWYLTIWLTLISPVNSAYAAWKAYAFRRALKQAKKLGWMIEFEDPCENVRKDGISASKKETSLEGVAKLAILFPLRLPKHRHLIHRLNPNHLGMTGFDRLRDLSFLKGLTRLKILSIMSERKLTNIDALENLTSLQEICLACCTSLPNVDSIKSLYALKSVNLSGCVKLTDLEALKNLTALRTLTLSGCVELTSVDAIKDLRSLESLTLDDCCRLTSVNPIKSLSALRYLNLERCTGLTKESISELRAALPNTKIITERDPLYLDLGEPRFTMDENWQKLVSKRRD